ncbi:hypothetical protein [Defluviimonas sp. SAOS-178_SWC]|uniref:hypothetical protein n=1 Tax=Defluviimonas sp. SAOS-178_SWC TaxID=3121287 RepID=UPI00322140B2
MTDNTRDKFAMVHETWSLIGQGDLAKRWNRSVRTLQRWRVSGYGPAHLVIGAGIHYRVNDVLAFESRMRRGGDDA